MVLRVMRNAFWLRYQPQEDESLEETRYIIDKVLYGDLRTDTPAKCGYFGGVLPYGDGHCIVDLVICMPRRVAVSAVLSPEKWKRMGARGNFCRGEYPHQRESVRRFVKRWCDAMSVKAFTVVIGSCEEVNCVLSEYNDRETCRVRQRRTGENVNLGGQQCRKLGVSALVSPGLPTVEVSHSGDDLSYFNVAGQRSVDTEVERGVLEAAFVLLSIYWNGSDPSHYSGG